MMAATRRDEPWYRQASRGVGSVVALGLTVFAIGALISVAFVLVMG